ncbi:CesD/SycD/LcrH family type III secretion system chaperone [Pandoraea sputorum]|uniref:CesD/SycD/LcrH family type III secretion system chaperone n=1 Tax=Pandoraea sputorum TaxID=93222 RepID=UPI0012535C76|nr:CesD/SycD/LcrH family type III secretion system chaperone [Pandoraea sputorum]VVE56199.1 CesD/SycD/LcrH family type III secretion system chaperone [Pandoraea sputorum]
MTMFEPDQLAPVGEHVRAAGTTLSATGLDPGDLDCVYAYACQLFDASDYAGAKRFYLLLVRLSPWQFDYWLALGLACQRGAEYDDALFCFGQAGLLRHDDPRPAYHAGLSHQLAGDPERAHEAFTAALKGCAERPEYAALAAEAERQAGGALLKASL